MRLMFDRYDACIFFFFGGDKVRHCSLCMCNSNSKACYDYLKEKGATRCKDYEYKALHLSDYQAWVNGTQTGYTPFVGCKSKDGQRAVCKFCDQCENDSDDEACYNFRKVEKMEAFQRMNLEKVIQ